MVNQIFEPLRFLWGLITFSSKFVNFELKIKFTDWFNQYYIQIGETTHLVQNQISNLEYKAYGWEGNKVIFSFKILEGYFVKFIAKDPLMPSFVTTQ